MTKNEVIEIFPKTGLVKEAWDLEVYKRAYAISLEIHRSAAEFPQTERFELASQMRRGSKSICANLAEGFAKQPFSDLEFKRFISISIGSASEMQVWIRYCYDLNYITDLQAKDWQSEYRIISKMLMKFHANA